MSSPYRIFNKICIPSLFQKSAHKRYEELIKSYKRQPTHKKSVQIQELIGTSTQIEDVFSAMAEEFDKDYYIKANPDVLISGIRAETHYLLWGWKENRNPSHFFDPVFYTARHRNIDKAEFPLAHYLQYARPLGLPGNAVSNRFWFEHFTPDLTDWLKVQPAKREVGTAAVVIMPVATSYDETLCSIFHVLAARSGDPYSLQILTWQNTDARIVEAVKELARRGLIDHHSACPNQSLDKVVWRALTELPRGLDVVLLQSDAYVFSGWFRRLQRHGEQDGAIAAIVPLSNRGTVSGYPLRTQDNYRALELSPADLDRMAADMNDGVSIETPIVSGPCVYLRRAAIEQIGRIDLAADFHLKAIPPGQKAIVAGDVFVYHTRFSGHPINRAASGVDCSGKSHNEADPGLALRRNLDAARLVRIRKGAVLLITHTWSGGIETYLSDLRRRLERESTACLMLRVHSLHHASFEDPADHGVFVPNLTDINLHTEKDFTYDLIRRLEPSLIQVNSLAGLEWPIQRCVLETISQFDRPRVFVGHDYAPISHHYNLISPEGNAFAGIPDLETLAEWDGLALGRQAIDACDHIERRSTFASFFDSGVKIEVPSWATQNIFKEYFPYSDITVVPHPDHLPKTSKAVRRPPDGKLKIASIGALRRAKGSKILAALAAIARSGRLPIEYHLIGDEVEDQLRASGVTVWGEYTSEEHALQRLDEIRPDLVLIPSIWPETFCYTLSIALQKGIPPVVFNLGAQAERVAEITWGAVLPVALADDPAGLSQTLLSLPVDKFWAEAGSESRRTG